MQTKFFPKFPDSGGRKAILSAGAISETIGTINPRFRFEQPFGKLLSQIGGVFVPDFEQKAAVPKRNPSLVAYRHRKPVNGPQ